MTGFLLLAGAAVLLVAGAELFTEHASAAGRRLGVSLLVIGLVLAGAEPEELFTAILAAVRERPAIAAGDAIGANITMLTLVLGLGALLRDDGQHSSCWNIALRHQRSIAPPRRLQARVDCP